MFNSDDAPMKWRVILRFSLDGDKENTRNLIATALREKGFENTGTGRWEAAASSPTDATNGVRAIFNYLQPEPELLDHLWIYVERVP